MENVFEQFTTLLGREPSAKEKADLEKLHQELGIGDNDALWTIILALQYHAVLYREIPDKIQNTVVGIHDEIKKIAAEEVKSAQATLANAVVDEAQRLSANWQWHRHLSLYILGLFVIFVFGALCFFAGNLSADGIIVVRDVLATPVSYLLCCLSC